MVIEMHENGTMERVVHTHPPQCWPVGSMDPLTSNWLANNLQQTPMWSKLSPPGCTHLTMIHTSPGY